jgi:hypothetical protein
MTTLENVNDSRTGGALHPPLTQATRRRNAIRAAARATEENVNALGGNRQTGLALTGKDTAERRLAALPSDCPSAVLTLIEKVALDPCADVEKLERLTAMYERLKAKEAELAYNAAKGRILKKLAGIKIIKNRPVLSGGVKGRPQKGIFEAFKYALLEEIDKHLRPLLAEEEMDLSSSDEPCKGGGIVIRGRLEHLPSGHYEDPYMSATLDTTGGKSNVQAVGSTNSFLRRYVACNIFNIVVGDDDGGTGGTIDENQTKTILDHKESQSRAEVSEIYEGSERRGSWLA